MVDGVLVNGRHCPELVPGGGRYCRLPEAHGPGEHRSKLQLCWEPASVGGTAVGNCYLRLGHQGLCAVLRYG